MKYVLAFVAYLAMVCAAFGTQLINLEKPISGIAYGNWNKPQENTALRPVTRGLGFAEIELQQVSYTKELDESQTEKYTRRELVPASWHTEIRYFYFKTPYSDGSVGWRLTPYYTRVIDGWASRDVSQTCKVSTYKHTAVADCFLVNTPNGMRIKCGQLIQVWFETWGEREDLRKKYEYRSSALPYEICSCVFSGLKRLNFPEVPQNVVRDGEYVAGHCAFGDSHYFIKKTESGGRAGERKTPVFNSHSIKYEWVKSQ